MKRWRESLRWIAITQGRGGPASSPSILLGQLLLRVFVVLDGDPGAQLA